MPSPLAAVELGSDTDAVHRARQFVRESLTGQPDEVTADAEVVVTELVTNALLHAADSEVRLRVGESGGMVRVEVEDGGHALPLRPVDSVDAMTGRGLKLVSALSVRWGVDPAAAGRKVVWAELTVSAEDRAAPVPEPEIDVDALLASWSDDLDAEERFTVRLGAVPTELLLDAKAHIDNLVREFTLATVGATADGGADVPAHLATLITTVVKGFAEARMMIKRQAIAAARRGDAETELVLTLPLSAADAGEEYLAALAEVDRYARAVRLLTLETPPVHQLFRSWYVQSLVDMLRAQAAGRPTRPMQTFPMRLADEVSALASLRATARRTAGLHDVGAALAGLTTPHEVADAVVRTGMDVLGASAGGLAANTDDRLEVLAAQGFRSSYIAELDGVPIDTSMLPGAVVIRTGEPLWIESAEERDARFPMLAVVEPGTVSTCLVPLVAGRRLGVLRFSFASPRLFDESERRFVLALADQAALALQRSELYVAERAARRHAEDLAEKLNLLMTVTGKLTGARTTAQILDIIIASATGPLGGCSASVHLFGGEGAPPASTRGGVRSGDLDALSVDVATALAFPGATARSGTVVLRGRAQIAARFPALVEGESGDPALVISPLAVGDRRLGVLATLFAGAATDDVLSLVSTLADAASQALERVSATAHASLAAERLRFLAEASVALSGRLDFQEALTVVAQLVVPKLADWCVIQVVEGTELVTAALAPADSDTVRWAAGMQRRYPSAASGNSGPARVVRTGRSELYPTISDEVLAAGATDADHLAMLRSIGMRSALVVPLTGRGGTFGAITMISTRPGRVYTNADQQFAEDLARRAALAVETVAAFQQQRGQLAAVTRIAEAAQHAILAPPPERAGPVALAARYVSATADALIGGDLYEVVVRPGAVRLLIGDVRGKGVEAVRNAAIVLGEFRAAAADLDDLERVAVQIDRRLGSYLQSEDFVTALIAEIDDHGCCTVVSCGHPPALVLGRDDIVTIDAPPSLPLGLGAAPRATTAQLRPGDRLLLYTDGLVEARDPDRRFVDVQALVTPLVSGALDAGLDQVLDALRAATGTDLADDLALLVAEYGGR